MNSHKAYEDVQLIKEMLSKTKKNVTGIGKYFFLWGYVILIAALSADYIAVNLLGHISMCWAVWLAAVIFGSVLTFIFISKEKKRTRVKTFFDRLGGYLGGGFGIAFLLSSLVYPALGAYPYFTIPIVTGMLAGTFLFITACLYQWKFLFGAAFIWWAATLAASLLPLGVRGWPIIFALIFGYIIPGHILHYKERKGQRDE